MKKLTYIIITGLVLVFIVGAFWITNSTNKTEQKATPTETPKKAKPANVKTISSQAKKTLNSLASSGADKASISDLNQLIKELKSYPVEKNDSGAYLQNLTACLEAVKSYTTGKADEKALGKVYPDFLASEQKLSAIEKTSQYDWFYAAAATNQQGLKEKGVVTLTMVGDNSFGTYPETPEHLKFDNVFKKNNGNNTYVFKNCLPWFKSDDYTVINAESAFTNATKAENKMWRIKSDPAHVAFLPASGVDAANLANNHTMDYFQVGYDETLKAFKDNNIPVFNADAPLETTIKGMKTVLLGYDCRMSQQSPAYLERIVKDVKKYKKEDTLVIVNMHWGVEYRETPTDYQTQFGHAILDAVLT